ncbi:unnamed protein product, partial [Ixodes persulcatus]
AQTYTGNDPDACKSIEHLVMSKGYPFESHKVETEDGYVIEMHRVPDGRTPSSRPGQPVFVMTGLGADSSIFVFDFPGQSLGFVLADDGYDVWLGNTRGSTYGKEHRRLDVKSKRFWNFSFHEHSLYDAPAQIDYVLNTTGSPSLIYIGYSQGTLMFFTMISERPEYNSKVRVFAGLAPYNKVAHIKIPGLKKITALHDNLIKAWHSVSKPEVSAHSWSSVVAARTLCAVPSLPVCAALADVLQTGTKYLNMSRLPVYMCNLPAGTSTKNMLHHYQLMASKKPQMFDYGREKNMKVYGQEEPPLYSLDKVQKDIGLFWSRGDVIVTPDEVRHLLQDLGPRVKKNHFIDDPDYAHASFALALCNPTVLHKDLLEFLNNYRLPSK